MKEAISKIKSPLVSIITPLYNAEYFIEGYIKNFSRIDYSNYEVVMVFDPSTDKGLEKTKKLIKGKKNFRIIANKTHQGISKSLNTGIKESKGKYIVFFMTDIDVDKNCVKELVKYIEKEDDPKLGAVVAKTYDFHKRDRIQAYRMYLLPQTGYLYIPEYGAKDSKRYNKPFEGYSGIDGTLFKREIFDVVGMFDTEIDLSVNDLDLIWRIWIAGYRVVRVPSAKVYHWSLKLGRGNVKWEFTYDKMLNLFIQNYTLKYLILYLPQLILVYTARSLVTLLEGNPDPLKGWLKSIYWSIGYLPKALEKRKKVQSIREVSDDDLKGKVYGDLSLWGFYKHIRWVQKNITPIMLSKESSNEKILTFSK